MAPWTWIEYIPWVDGIVKYYYQFVDWAVHAADKYLFHNYKTLVSPNGSGDTSYNWTQLWLYLLLSFGGCITWSLFDRKRSQYNQLGYWLRIFVRYFLIINCFDYGLQKLFLLQMHFPRLSELSTPLGDLPPGRFAWVFMGYSSTYQFFSGAMEVLAGLLLLFRRTSSFGALLGAGVFGNVMMMNLGYDIAVKLFSIHLFILCLLLLAFEYKRILGFLLANRATVAGNLYNVWFPKKWMRITRIVLKCLFVVIFFIKPVNNYYGYYKLESNPKEIKPIRSGIYDVDIFVLNKDTIPTLITDTLRWQDLVFEYGRGSIKTGDTIFMTSNHRGYFHYTTDTIKQEIEFTKRDDDDQLILLFRLHYELPDSNTVQLSGMIRKDSVYVLLKKSKRHFKLADSPFHWLTN